MKFRILDNTLRVRLSMPEIERFTAGHAVTAQVVFPGSGQLAISVRSDASQASTRATFSAGHIDVCVPATSARALAPAEVVTIDETVAGEGGVDLSIKIEKDFRCLTPRDEDESQLFQHPAET